MRVQVTVHGLFTVAVGPSGTVELIVPEGTDVEGVIKSLSETSSLFHPLACLAVINGMQVPLSRTLEDGEHLQLYPIFGGG